MVLFVDRARFNLQSWQMNGKGKTLRACNKKRGTNNVVIIDVDSDNCNDDILVDAPEYLRGSSSNGLRKDGKYSLESVICIDDDEDDDENAENNNLDKGRYAQNNSTPVKLSKCKRTYSGPSTSNRYGWSTDTESVSTDDDDDSSSDCELEFEGSSGKLKRDWEKAFLRRQNEFYSGVDQAGNSFGFDSHQDNGAGDDKERYSDGSESTSYTSREEGDRSPSIRMDNGKSERIFCNNAGETSTLNRADNVCNDHSFVTDHSGMSNICTDNEPIGTDMDNKDGSPVEINDVVNGQSFMDKSNGSVFFNREMHKETDEYRRSVQEELEARQRALQIQAEEAQQLKRLEKRKKSAAMRLLDMERRQKLRVEEIRNSQKKDEENLNLKEQLRTKVRKDLDRLEAACHDMESILRGLGINVIGVNGVNVAFKRALLTFHPDRASQSDIRGQVEAEEKFKLVTRMKEKYLSKL